MRGYAKRVNEANYVSFLIKDAQLLKKYSKSCDKVSNSTKKEFYNESVRNGKHLKSKLKSYEDRINTNFRDSGMSKEGFHWICLSAILIDTAFKMGENQYPQVLLGEC